MLDIAQWIVHNYYQTDNGSNIISEIMCDGGVLVPVDFK